jgi:anti-sigma-K factor RskA
MDIKDYISSGIIELYVMGLCSPEEEKELEQLRLQHPALHEAILRYEEELESKMLQESTMPPSEVDKVILKKLKSLGTPVIPIDSIKQVQSNGKTPVRWLRPVAAAALLLLGISAYFNYTLYKKTKEQEKLITGTANSPLPAGDYAVMTNPTITPVAMYGVGTHTICRCTIFWDKNTGKAYVMIHHLPKSSSAKDYYLWAEVNGKPVNVGILNDEIRGRFIEMPNIPEGAVAFAVTLEKAGGGVTSPTLSEMYLAGKI